MFDVLEQEVFPEVVTLEASDRPKVATVLLVEKVVLSERHASCPEETVVSRTLVSPKVPEVSLHCPMLVWEQAQVPWEMIALAVTDRFHPKRTKRSRKLDRNLSSHICEHQQPEN